MLGYSLYWLMLLLFVQMVESTLIEYVFYGSGATLWFYLTRKIQSHDRGDND